MRSSRLRRTVEIAIPSLQASQGRRSVDAALRCAPAANASNRTLILPTSEASCRGGGGRQATIRRTRDESRAAYRRGGVRTRVRCKVFHLRKTTMSIRARADVSMSTLGSEAAELVRRLPLEDDPNEVTSLGSA